jgi:hypothetical protein
MGKSPRVVEEFAYYRHHTEENIKIGPEIEIIEDNAFSECVVYEQNDGKLTRIGNLEKIYIPYGVSMSRNAAARIGVDFYYMTTGIPTKITDKITFYVYDPYSGMNLFSACYPIFSAIDFSATDYPKILNGEFYPSEVMGKVEIATYNDFSFSTGRAIRKAIDDSYYRTRTKTRNENLVVFPKRF